MPVDPLNCFSLEHALRLAGDCGRRVDNPDALAHDILDLVDHKRVMRAAQYDGIDVVRDHWFEGSLQDAPRLWALEIPCFDLLHQARAGILEQLHALGKTLNDRGEQRPLERSGRSQNADYAG